MPQYGSDSFYCSAKLFLSLKGFSCYLGKIGDKSTAEHLHHVCIMQISAHPLWIMLLCIYLNLLPNFLCFHSQKHIQWDAVSVMLVYIWVKFLRYFFFRLCHSFFSYASPSWARPLSWQRFGKKDWLTNFRFNDLWSRTDKAHDLQPGSYDLILGLWISGCLSIRW